MSGSGGFFRYRCKFFYKHNCPNWVYVNNSPCASCIESGREASERDDNSERDLSSIFDGTSQQSISAPTSVSGSSLIAIAAIDQFVDLVYAKIHIQQLVRSTSVDKILEPDQFQACIRHCLKVLSKDLSLEHPEYGRFCEFLNKSSRLISRAIENATGRWQSNVDDNHSDIESSDSDTEHPGPQQAPDILALRETIESSRSFQAFVKNVHDIFYPSFSSRLRWFVQEENLKSRNLQSLIPLQEAVSELLYSQPSTINVSFNNDRNLVHRAQNWLDRLSFEKWNWWPLSPAQEPLQPNHARLEWRCKCGDLRTTQLPTSFARRISNIRQRSNPDTPNNESRSTSGKLPSRVTTDNVHRSSPTVDQDNEMSIPLRNLSPLNTNPQIITIGHDLSNRCVYFMTYSDKLHRSEIISDSMCNDVFFENLRSEYYRRKGWLRSWFGLKSFSHCDFHKFETYFSGRYSERETGIPPTGDQTYYYEPRPMDTEPPVSAHKFNDRFYKRIPTCGSKKECTCGARDAIDRIPQRDRSITVAQTQKREFFWGIIARDHKSGLRVLTYILLSSLPGFVFFFLWLFAWGHENLQDASVLLMISFSLLGVLYAAQLF
ncbi:hypothetical protein F4810DRAFT_677814 [Camillea tinctor]|nr:hypothetical protein F4810DRAFT_677814 [Camillea tinctor]